MKFVTEYRDSEQAKGIAAELAATVDPNREYRFMEFCGGHTHVLARWGLTDILPKNVHMIHGRLPGLRASDRPYRYGDGMRAEA